MRAFTIHRYGGNEVVQFESRPDPEVLSEDVLVQVYAASVNPVDFKIRAGKLKFVLPYRLPLILGNDLSGVILKVGSQVTRFKPGDQVYARPDKNRIGSFAELISVNQDAVAFKPKNLTMEEAASIPLVGLTSWQAFVDIAALQPGQRVLIHAGSGGVGTFAIQLAKHLCAWVATTTSTSNVDLVKSLGADEVVDYRKESFEKVLKDFDVVFDTLGGDTIEKSLQVLKPGGKLISISGPPDPEFAREIQANPLLSLAMRLLSWRVRRGAGRRRVKYSFLFMKPNGEQLSEITSLIENGVIRPMIDKSFPFESTKDALAYVETGRAKGKVVILMKPQGVAS